MWFRVNVSSDGASNVISCAGELDASTAGRIADAASLCLERSVPQIVVDTSDVTFIDSAGIEALVGIAKRCRERGTGFRLIPSKRVAEIARRMGAGIVLGLAKSIQTRRVSIGRAESVPAEPVS